MDNTRYHTTTTNTIHLTYPPFCRPFQESIHPPDILVRDSPFEIDIEDFDICRKKSSNGNYNHLLFVGFTKFPSSVSNFLKNNEKLTKRFKEHIPIMKPNDYETKDHTSRKSELLQKYLHIVTLNEHQYDQYVYLVEKFRLKHSFSELLSIVSRNQTLYRINNIKSRIEKFIKITEKANYINENVVEGKMTDDEMYITSILYWFCNFFVGGDKYKIFNDEWIDPTTIQLFGQEIIWLIHLVHPELESKYQKCFCSNLTVDYVPTYSFTNGRDFAEQIYQSICYFHFIVGKGIVFKLSVLGLDAEVFLTNNEKHPDFQKIINFLKNDEKFKLFSFFMRLERELEK